MKRYFYLLFILAVFSSCSSSKKLINGNVVVPQKSSNVQLEVQSPIPLDVLDFNADELSASAEVVVVTKHQPVYFSKAEPVKKVKKPKLWKLWFRFGKAQEPVLEPNDVPTRTADRMARLSMVFGLMAGFTFVALALASPFVGVPFLIVGLIMIGLFTLVGFTTSMIALRGGTNRPGAALIGMIFSGIVLFAMIGVLLGILTVMGLE